MGILSELEFKALQMIQVKVTVQMIHVESKSSAVFNISSYIVIRHMSQKHLSVERKYFMLIAILDVLIHHLIGNKNLRYNCATKKFSSGFDFKRKRWFGQKIKWSYWFWLFLLGLRQLSMRKQLENYVDFELAAFHIRIPVFVVCTCNARWILFSYQKNKDSA